MTKIVEILLFEDNPGDAGLIEEMVSDSTTCSYELKIAETLEEGMNLLNVDSYDVILLDLGLPDSDGINTFLNVQRESSGTPIIILTGLNDGNIGINAVQRGAQDYLIKGNVDTDLLERSIKYSIERQKLAERIQMIANVVEFTEDAVITKSLDGMISSWNTGAEQIYGYTAAEVIGKHISILSPPQLHDEIEELIERIKNGERIQHYETLRIRKDGSIIIISATLSPIFDTSGKLVAISTIARDITEKKNNEKELLKYRDNLEEQVHKRTEELKNINEKLSNEIDDHKKTEAELEKYLSELERSNKELQQFAYVASHDLQEPLRMVASFTQLLQKNYEGQLDADADEFIKYAVDGAQRMQMLINDLLTYSRVSTRGEDFQQTDLEKAFDESLMNLKLSIDDNNALITHDTLPTIMADSSQVIQLFQNLVGNAIKFRGMETPEIHVAAEEGEDEWIFRVIDNGIGIDPKHTERIFRVFQRLHERDKYPGTGIGLSICEKIVERHGGEIWVDSKQSAGSAFCFTISKYI